MTERDFTEQLAHFAKADFRERNALLGKPDDDGDVELHKAYILSIESVNELWAHAALLNDPRESDPVSADDPRFAHLIADPEPVPIRATVTFYRNAPRRKK